MLPTLTLAFSLLLSSHASVIQQRQTPDNSTGTSVQLGKAGLAWDCGNADLSQFESTKVSWIYTRGPYTPDVQGASKLEYVHMYDPQLWSPSTADTFSSYVNEKTITEQGIKHVLGFNGPDQPGQSDLLPDAAVQLWRDHLLPLRQYNVSLGSPAISSATGSKQWLIDFTNACSGCYYEFIAVHFYGTDPAAFITYLEDTHATFPDKPIWVTEFACRQEGGEQCAFDDAVAFMKTTVAWLDAASYIERYAWFGICRNDSVINDGNLSSSNLGSNGYHTNDLGYYYLN